MIRMTREEEKQVQMDMLRAFVKFCDEHNLRYFLDAGTLLGAVRHDGYIPWDDDIDVGMPRADHDRFIELAKDGFGEHYKVLTPEESNYVMAKIIDTRTVVIEFPETHRIVISVYIDLYPKDGLPDKSKKSYRVCKKVANLAVRYYFNKKLIYSWKKSGSIVKRTLAFFGRHLLTEKSKQKPLVKINKLAKKYAFDDSPYVATIIAGGMKNCVPTSCLSTYIPHKFETETLNIPVGYDEYLKALYGDYMTLPPEEKRYVHNNEAYWLTEEDHLENIK